MKRSHLWSLSLLASLSVVSTASPVEPAKLVGSNTAYFVEEPQDLERLPAENVDGSKVNMKTHSAAALIIKEFNDGQEEDLMGAASAALVKFNELHSKDSLHLPTMTWIAYLSQVTGNHSRAIEVLEAIKGRSQDESVNIMNLNNLCASYYTTQQYDKAAESITELNSKVPPTGRTMALLGSCYVMSKKYDLAISPLEEARTLLGDDTESLRNVNVDLGISYSRTNQPERAMNIFDAMLEDDQLTSVQLGWMGYVYLQNKRYDSAIMALERAYAMDSNNEGVVNNLATSYLSRGNTGDEAKAASLYEELTNISTGNPIADYNVGSIYLSKGEYAKAKPFLMRAAQSNDPFALNNLGRAHEGLGEDQDAYKNYSRASDLRTDLVIFAKNAGFAAARLKNHEMTIKYLERALTMEKSADVLVPLAGAYDGAGMGEKATAIWMMPEVRETRQNDAQYWFSLGVSHASAGQAAEAEAAYRRSLQINPNNAEVLSNLGVLLWNNGNYEGALDCFKKQSALQPENGDAIMNVAACHVKLGQISEAVEIWRGVVRANPNRTDVRLDLADGLWNTGDTPGARFHYASVLKSDSNNARALNGMGMWALLQTQNEEAEEYFRRSIRSDRKYIPAFQNLAVVLERQNKVAEAIKTLEAALAMDANNQSVKEQLARLKSE